MPIHFRWDGEAMKPLHLGHAAKEYEVGEVYPLEVQQLRSANSHSHFFASLHEGWQNLPEDISWRFPTPEHLRKWLLIKTGYRDERSIIVSSRSEAERVAAFVRPSDPFAVVVADATLVTVYTAKSQSAKAMGRAEFQRSKQAVLDALAEMIGVSPEALNQRGRDVA